MMSSFKPSEGDCNVQMAFKLSLVAFLEINFSPEILILNKQKHIRMFKMLVSKSLMFVPQEVHMRAGS